MLNLKVKRIILPLMRGADITIWLYVRNLDQKWPFVSSYSKLEFKRCPFGLAQAPAYFQRLVDEVLLGLIFAFGYLDDIFAFSPDMRTHLENLRLLFERLRVTDLKLKEVKCNFLKRHIQYLGHIVSGEGITPLLETLNSIQKFHHPRPQKKLNNFLVS